MISIITPTYNRAHLLPRLYESLKRQTLKDFEWIVVDDGSLSPALPSREGEQPPFHPDSEGSNAPALVKAWSQDGFETRYVWKPNGGKHTAVNLGVGMAKGELVFICDSDDVLLPESIARVAEAWEQVKDRENIGGVAGLDVDMASGRVIGSGLPADAIDCNAMDIRYRHHVQGDLKEVFRTSVLREFPFPVIEGERFSPEQLTWFRIAQKYKLHYFNQPIYRVEYQADGISAGITRARMHSPVASMMTYAEMLGYDIPFREKVKAAINYWRFRCCKPRGCTEFPRVPLCYSLLRPMGWLMHRRDVARQ